MGLVDWLGSTVFGPWVRLQCSLGIACHLQYAYQASITSLSLIVSLHNFC
jgi:hypothetical protein